MCGDFRPPYILIFMSLVQIRNVEVAAELPVFICDLTPFKHSAPLVDVNARNGRNAPGAKVSQAMDFSDYDRAPMFALNEVIWKSIHGADAEMPLPISRFHIRY